MTDVVPAQAPGAVALPNQRPVGLEDVSDTDLVMPTIRIEHKGGVFKDALSGETFDTLTAIFLGLVKQRVLWDPEIEDSPSGPWCRSYNFSVGHPDEKNFPWDESGFEKQEGTLPCADCPLKNWGTHPKNDTPFCSEQHTFPLLVMKNEMLRPALLTIQRSAIKPSRTYLSSYIDNNEPLFSAWTTVTLDHRRRGQVDFAVPKFAKGVATDTNLWPQFAQQLAEIRHYVQTPRSGSDEEEVVPTGATEAPVAAPTAAPAPPVAAPAPAPPAPAPVATEAPSVPPVAAPAAPNPAPAPVAEPAPEPAPAAPVAAAPAPVQEAAPAPAPAVTPPAASGGDDLPF